MGGCSFQQTAIGESRDCIEAAEIHPVDPHCGDHQKKGLLPSSRPLLDVYVRDLFLNIACRNLRGKQLSFFSWTLLSMLSRLPGLQMSVECESQWGWQSARGLCIWHWCCCILFCWSRLTQPTASTRGYGSLTKVGNTKCVFLPFIKQRTPMLHKFKCSVVLHQYKGKDKAYRWCCIVCEAVQNSQCSLNWN